MKFLMALITVFSLQIANAKVPKVLLTTTNSCNLYGEVDDQSMRAMKFCLAKAIQVRKGQDYPIYLVLNSPGGSIYDGLKFIEFAKTIHNLETVTIFAASMASAIVEALPGKRHMAETGVFMFHRARGTFSGQFADGELEQRLAMWKKVVTRMEQVNSNRIGITLKKYKQNVKDEWWLYGRDAVKSNVADSISEIRCSIALINTIDHYEVDSFLGKIKYSMSRCPLVN